MPKEKENQSRNLNQWYKCQCGQEWEAPGHPDPKTCPECETSKNVREI